MATATTSDVVVLASTTLILDIELLIAHYENLMDNAEKLESKGATIKNRIYEARALEVATLIRDNAPTEEIKAQAEEMRKQAEARAFNHKAVKEERAIRRAEFKAANPTATEQE